MDSRAVAEFGVRSADNGKETAGAALESLACRYPGLLDKSGRLAVAERLPGASKLHAVLKSIEFQAGTAIPDTKQQAKKHS